MSRDQMRHHVRRLTFCLIHQAIEELKGPAGLDESGVSLFKTPGMIDLIQKKFVYNIETDSVAYCDGH